MRTSLTLALGALSALACNAFDPPVGELVDGQRIKRTVPTDDRAAIQQALSPPPISGGTLLVSSKNLFITSDPARGRISFVDPSTSASKSVTELTLERHSRPGRLAEDSAGNIHVVLRNSGKVAMLESNGASVLGETSVCATPRGIAYDANQDLLHVACAEGVLQSFKPGAKTAETELELEPDLRDVVVENQRLYVSRFRSAEVLFVEESEVIHRATPPRTRTRTRDFNSEEILRRKANVAWRMVAAPEGGVVLLHQRSVTDPIELTGTQQAAASPYGGDPGSCQEIVQTAVTVITGDGLMRSSPAISGMVLGVDVAVDESTGQIAVVSAGLRDFEAPRQSVEMLNDGFGPTTSTPTPASFFSGNVALLDPATFDAPSRTDEIDSHCTFSASTGGQEPAVAVAFDPENPSRLAIQQRQPAVLQFANRQGSFFGEPTTADDEGSPLNFPSYNLAGDSIEDTGHEIFHRNSGGGLACASCHPEGEDDGHVWTFSDIGPRKTQNLGQPLKDTAPFHWDGSLPTLRSLMDDVFVERMGGVFQSEDRMATLETWIFDREPVIVPVKDTAAAKRGKKLFESEKVGCASCHSGDSFTDNKSYSVGTSDGAALQVPPLRGLRLHPPFMHNGCAKTLRERFDKDCGGGDRHGKVSHLSSNDLDDLVAYLESI